MRFYAMPFVPSRLWSRLILGLIMAMDRFSQSCWHGLEIQKMPQLTFWQEGLNISYSGGFIVIESAVFRSTTTGKQTKGILISILTDSSTLGDLAVIGFVTDELDSALQNTFHDYHENNDLFGIYALCPVCFNVRPCEGVVRGERLHFSLADCAGDLLYDDYIPCEHGNLVDLVNLIPEFLLCELPARLHIVPQELDLKERLGGGAVGTVHKGVWRGEEVAVKLFYQNSVPAQTGAVDLDVVPDSGTSTMSSCGSRDSVVNGNVTDCSVYGNFKMLSDSFRARTYDRMDGRNLKVLKAFSELRQEIVILSQLNHPCLISLLGVSVRPSLLVALELAPLGSLRSVLDTRMEGRRFNRYHYQDKDKTFVSVLDKDITFKIVYQVCVGLEYLHERSIVYRDLKPDNILVRSMEARETINIKLSDYGIAKFTTPQGTMGKVGTPGYMAPELMEGQSYNEKVDIFSFSMVIYELLSGHPPFEKCGRLHQIHHIVNVEKKRPSLMEYNVIPNFPFLENMMESMWAHDAHRRPAATALKERMEDVSFLLQHTHLGTPCEVAPAPVARAHTSTASVMDSCGLFWNVTCAWASKENSRAVSVTGRNNCWVWESPSTNIYDRRLSIYNLATGKPQAPICKNCPGLPVTCMAKVGQKMWMGVQGGSIEIHGCTQTDFNKGRSRVEDLGADPIAIIHDKDNAKAQKLHPDGLGFVYVGLSDGTVLVYHHHSHKRGVFTNEWTRFKTLTITSETRLQALCFLPRQKDLVAACGHSLIIISTDSMLVERRICLLKDVPQHVRDKVGALHTLVKNDDTLWCSFKNSPLILELEVQTWKLTAAYCIEADLEVYVTEVKIASGAGEEGACEECGGRSSFHESSSRSVKEDPTPRPPPRPPRVTKPSVQTDPRPQSPARPPKPDAQTEARTLSPARPPRLTEPSAQADPGPLSPARPPRLTKPSSQADPRPFSPARPPRLTEPSAQADPRPLSPTNITVEVQQPALPPVPRRDLKPSLGTSPGAAETAKMKELEMQGAVFGSVSSRKSSTESASESLISADDETFDNYVSEHYGRRPRSDADLLSSSSSSDLRGLEKSALERKKSNTLPNPSTRRKPPPVPPTPPPPVCRRSLPSEHDGVYVQSLLCVHDALWVGSSCGEILVIGVQKRTTPCPTESPANPRMSLNLDAKQMCNLKSVRMVEDQDKMDPENKRHCGGVHTMVQARNMVVAVRCISQQQDIDEVSVWNACSADRFSLVRQYWCALRPH